METLVLYSISIIFIVWILSVIFCSKKACTKLGYCCRILFCNSWYKKIFNDLLTDDFCRGFNWIQERNYHKNPHLKKIRYYASFIALFDKIAYPKTTTKLFRTAFFISLIFPFIFFLFFGYESVDELLHPIKSFKLNNFIPINTNKDFQYNFILIGLMIIPLVQLILQNNNEISQSFLNAFARDDQIRNTEDEEKTNPFLDEIRKIFTRTVQASSAGCEEAWNMLCLNEWQNHLQKNVEQAVQVRLAIISRRYPTSISILVSFYIVIGLLSFFISYYSFALFMLLASLSIMLFSIWLNLRSLFKMHFLERMCTHMDKLINEIRPNERGILRGVLERRQSST